MKSLFMTIAMAALLFTACGHRASNSTVAGDSVADILSADSTDAAFTVDTITVEKSDTMADVRVSIEWPVDGPEALVNNIRAFILLELDSTKADNGKAAASQVVKKNYDELYQMGVEARENGYGIGMTMSYSKQIIKLHETDTYVTYLVKNEGFTGGAHGYFMVTGATFSKPDGQRIGYERTLDSESNTYYIQNQTLFQDSKNPNLIALLKQGVRSYFNDNGQSMTDEELSDMLINVGDINHIPLPQYAPYFTPKGLTFVYQQYEIAPYAAGLPCFTLSYEKVLPFLTDEAARLTK